MKKVLFIHHFPPPLHGAALLGQFIQESTIINTSFNCKYINLGTSVSLVEIGKGGLKKYLRFFAMLKNVVTHMANFKPDLVYITVASTGMGFYKDAIVALLVKMFKVKVVYHFNNKGIVDHQDKWFDDKLYKWVFKNAKVLVSSEGLYTDVEKYATRDNVYYCANGIPEVNLSNEKIIKDPNCPQLLFLSNLLVAKGVYVLLEACQILKEKGVSYKCIYIGGIGDITEEEFNKAVSAKKLENEVVYVGKKYGDEKTTFYANADVFILPTLNECFPLVLLEAMQFSLPIISTYEGGIPEIVENGITGFLVEKENALELSDKLEILIKDEKLRLKMGAIGRERYETNFTLLAFENRIHNVLSNILKL